MWQRFTERARKVIVYAQEAARNNSESYVSTEHLLLGLIRENDHVAAQILARLGVPLEKVGAEVEKHVTQGSDKPNQDMQLTPRAKRVIDLAYDEARLLRHNYIGTEHLLLALIREGEGLAGRVLADLGIKGEDARRELVFLQNETLAKKGAGGDSEDLLTMDDAAQFLGVSKPTLYRLLSANELKGVKVGRQWRFRKADLAAYLGGKPAPAEVPSPEIDEELEWIEEALAQAGSVPAASTGSIRTLAERILKLAILMKSSDIHMDPVRSADEDFLLMRFRSDGTLREIRRFTRLVGDLLLGEFKVLADIEVDAGAPQEGRIPVQFQLSSSEAGAGGDAVPTDGPAPHRKFTIYVQTLPTAYGEAMTMRIMEVPKEMGYGLDDLGFSDGQLAEIRKWIESPRGLIIGIGPEGSGKSTPLYAMLREVASVEVKTFAFADPPVEIPYVTPLAAGSDSGDAGIELLRAAYRGADPDVLFYDQATDIQIARLLVDIALNGHLILTTIEAPSLAAVLERLQAGAVEPLLICRSMVGIIVQRLVRKLCASCRKPSETSVNDPALRRLREMAFAGGYALPEGGAFWQIGGCDQCRGTGYKGRIGLFQVITWNEMLSEALLSGADGAEIDRVATLIAPSILADGIRKAAGGETTIEEVLRVAGGL